MVYQPSSEKMGISGSLNEWLVQNNLRNDLQFMADLEKRIDYYSEQYKQTKDINAMGTLAGFHALIDENIDKIDNETKSQIKCKKGCSFCCHIPVTISEAEADFIGYYSKKNNIRISKKYLKKQLRIPESEIYLSPVSACVFLKDKICSIYPARPLNCRKYLVFSDPLLCNAKRGLEKPLNYFDYNIEAIISGVFSCSPVGRLPEMLLPYSK